MTRRLPGVDAVIVEWDERRLAEKESLAAHSSFSHIIQAADGALEPTLPCSNPICHDGGFEILEVVEWMVSNRQEQKSGLLVCIGWEHTTGKQTAQLPCTRVISYRIGLTYRKRSDVRRSPTTEKGHDNRCDQDG